MDRFTKLQEKIKAFTQEMPTNTGPMDNDYKIYLAECSKLQQLDFELCSLKNDIYSDEYVNAKLDILEEEIGKIVKRRIS